MAYAARRSAAVAAGLLWGAFHFLDLTDGATQAQHFLSVANADAETLVALDWETIGNRQPSAGIAKDFLTEIQTSSAAMPSFTRVRSQGTAQNR